MTEAERLVALGVPPQLAVRLVRRIADGSINELTNRLADLEARMAAAETTLDNTIITDEAP